MSAALTTARSQHSVALVALRADQLAAWCSGAEQRTRNWIETCAFRGKPGTHCVLPDAQGKVGAVLVGVGNEEDPFCLGNLPALLTAGDYHLECDWDQGRRERAMLGWALGAYSFSRYRATESGGTVLAIDGECDAQRILGQVQAIHLVRDLINTPAEDMMPEHLGAAATELAQQHGASVVQVIGDELRAENYPAIHAVGRAATHAPRLIDIRWGERDQPQITLVGKGVCFDSGGLNLKTASGMRLMKKDMGGAAHALGLASMIMSARLPIQLRVLIPAVENAVAGNAYRPGDVIRSRSGQTIEIDNTDAEGRIILCDALAEAATETPGLIVDFATLTGAARVALGPDLPALFCNSDEVAEQLMAAAARVRDPLWRMPLHQPYRQMLDSRIADLVNSASGPFAGAITAALFLESFVPESIPWVHLDLMAWNPQSRPGRPEGGEAMGIRALMEHLEQRFRS